MIVAKEEVKDYREYYNEEKKLTNNKVLNDKRDRRRKANKKKSKARLSFLKTVVIIFLICIFILNRYTKITRLNYEVSNLEKEVVELTREKEDLKTELEGLKNVAKIEKHAKLQLGMDYPTEEQIVSLNVKEDIFRDHNIATETDFNVVKYFKNIVNMVLKFF